MKVYPRQSPNTDRSDFTAVFNAIKRGKIFNGELIRDFEKNIKEYVGMKYIIMCNMGRGAEYFALKSLGLSPGDEIIIASYNFPIVPMVVKMLGFKPVFVDVDPETYMLDPKLVEKSITKKTKAILVTHLAGQSCEMDEILVIKEKYKLKLIEDAVQSLGAKYKERKVGTFGDVSYFSFHVGKGLTTFVGAAVLTNDEVIFERMKKTSNEYGNFNCFKLFGKVFYGAFVHFLSKPNYFKILVYPFVRILYFFNSEWLDDSMSEQAKTIKYLPRYCMQKFSNIQAALGCSQLEKFDDSIEKRVRNAKLLSSKINAKYIGLPTIGNSRNHVFTYYFIRVKNRKEFRRNLLIRGVDTKRDSNLACSHLDIFKNEYVYCPESEKISKENLLIPNYPSLDEKEIEHIANMVNQAYCLANISTTNRNRL